MDRLEMAGIIAGKLNISKEQAKRAIRLVMDEVVAEILATGRCQLAGIGTLSVCQRQARAYTGFGVTRQLPARKAVKFRVSKTLKAAVNE